MSKKSVLSILLRGFGLGLLAALVNGLSLPSVTGLSMRVVALLETGAWPSGPLYVLELWVIHFVFGLVCSLLPSVIAGIVLSGGILGAGSHNGETRVFSTWVWGIISIVIAAFYVPLLFYVEPVLDLPDYGILAAFIFLEQAAIFGWMTARSAARQQTQTKSFPASLP